MLVSGPFPTSAMGRAGGEGSSVWSSDSGSPPMVCEWRRSLASSWEWSWYLERSREQHGEVAGAPAPRPARPPRGTAQWGLSTPSTAGAASPTPQVPRTHPSSLPSNVQKPFGPFYLSPFLGSVFLSRLELEGKEGKISHLLHGGEVPQRT